MQENTQLVPVPECSRQHVTCKQEIPVSGKGVMIHFTQSWKSTTSLATVFTLYACNGKMLIYFHQSLG